MEADGSNIFDDDLLNVFSQFREGKTSSETLQTKIGQSLEDIEKTGMGDSAAKRLATLVQGSRHLMAQLQASKTDAAQKSLFNALAFMAQELIKAADRIDKNEEQKKELENPLLICLHMCFTALAVVIGKIASNTSQPMNELTQKKVRDAIDGYLKRCFSKEAGTFNVYKPAYQAVEFLTKRTKNDGEPKYEIVEGVIKKDNATSFKTATVQPKDGTPQVQTVYDYFLSTEHPKQYLQSLEKDNTFPKQKLKWMHDAFFVSNLDHVRQVIIQDREDSTKFTEPKDKVEHLKRTLIELVRRPISFQLSMEAYAVDYIARESSLIVVPWSVAKFWELKRNFLGMLDLMTAFERAEMQKNKTKFPAIGNPTVLDPSFFGVSYPPWGLDRSIPKINECALRFAALKAADYSLASAKFKEYPYKRPVRRGYASRFDEKVPLFDVLPEIKSEKEFLHFLLMLRHLLSDIRKTGIHDRYGLQAALQNMSLFSVFVSPFFRNDALEGEPRMLYLPTVIGYRGAELQTDKSFKAFVEGESDDDDGDYSDDEEDMKLYWDKVIEQNKENNETLRALGLMTDGFCRVRLDSLIVMQQIDFEDENILPDSSHYEDDLMTESGLKIFLNSYLLPTERDRIKMVEGWGINANTENLETILVDRIGEMAVGFKWVEDTVSLKDTLKNADPNTLMNLAAALQTIKEDNELLASVLNNIDVIANRMITDGQTEDSYVQAAIFKTNVKISALADVLCNTNYARKVLKVTQPLLFRVVEAVKNKNKTVPGASASDQVFNATSLKPFIAEILCDASTKKAIDDQLLSLDSEPTLLDRLTRFFVCVAFETVNRTRVHTLLERKAKLQVPLQGLNYQDLFVLLISFCDQFEQNAKTVKEKIEFQTQLSENELGRETRSESRSDHVVQLLINKWMLGMLSGQRKEVLDLTNDNMLQLANELLGVNDLRDKLIADGRCTVAEGGSLMPNTFFRDAYFNNWKVLDEFDLEDAKKAEEEKDILFAPSASRATPRIDAPTTNVNIPTPDEIITNLLREILKYAEKTAAPVPPAVKTVARRYEKNKFDPTRVGFDSFYRMWYKSAVASRLKNDGIYAIATYPKAKEDNNLSVYGKAVRNLQATSDVTSDQMRSFQEYDKTFLAEYISAKTAEELAKSRETEEMEWIKTKEKEARDTKDKDFEVRVSEDEESFDSEAEQELEELKEEEQKELEELEEKEEDQEKKKDPAGREKKRDKEKEERKREKKEKKKKDKKTDEEREKKKRKRKSDEGSKDDVLRDAKKQRKELIFLQNSLHDCVFCTKKAVMGALEIKTRRLVATACDSRECAAGLLEIIHE